MVLSQPDAAPPSPTREDSYSKEQRRSRKSKSSKEAPDEGDAKRLSRIMLETDDDDKVAKTKAHLRKLINDLEMKLENFDEEVAKAEERAKQQALKKKEAEAKKSINFDDNVDESGLPKPSKELSKISNTSESPKTDTAEQFIDDVTARLDADLSAV